MQHPHWQQILHSLHNAEHVRENAYRLSDISILLWQCTTIPRRAFSFQIYGVALAPTVSAVLTNCCFATIANPFRCFYVDASGRRRRPTGLFLVLFIWLFHLQILVSLPPFKDMSSRVLSVTCAACCHVCFTSLFFGYIPSAGKPRCPGLERRSRPLHGSIWVLGFEVAPEPPKYVE